MRYPLLVHGTKKDLAIRLQVFPVLAASTSRPPDWTMDPTPLQSTKHSFKHMLQQFRGCMCLWKPLSALPSLCSFEQERPQGYHDDIPGRFVVWGRYHEYKSVHFPTKIERGFPWFMLITASSHQYNLIGFFCQGLAALRRLDPEVTRYILSVCVGNRLFGPGSSYSAAHHGIADRVDGCPIQARPRLRERSTPTGEFMVLPRTFRGHRNQGKTNIRSRFRHGS